MDIAELRECRKTAEMEILNKVSVIIKDYQTKTGVKITNVSINMANIQVFGGPPESLVADVSLSIEI